MHLDSHDKTLQGRTSPIVIGVSLSTDTLSVDLSDGRTIAVPLMWFPRLWHGTPSERANHELGRNGVHWPELDEDIPIDGLLNGEQSGESLKSIRRWLDGRAKSEAQGGGDAVRV